MRLALPFAALALSACLGTTGNHLVRFTAGAAGPVDAVAGKPLEFTSGLGFHVFLTKATLHIGAVYLDETLPASGGGPSACVLQGTYVAEVTTDPNGVAGIDVDILSPTPQIFPNYGEGTDVPAKAAQVWLTGVQVDEPQDSTTILHVEGTFDKDGMPQPFQGDITIGSNRQSAPTDPTKPGTHPICKERIVSPILVDITPRNGGMLVVRVDPRELFVDIDFSKMKDVGLDTPLYAFRDDNQDGESVILYKTLHSAGSLYQISWEDSP